MLYLMRIKQSAWCVINRWSAKRVRYTSDRFPPSAIELYSKTTEVASTVVRVEGQLRDTRVDIEFSVFFFLKPKIIVWSS